MQVVVIGYKHAGKSYFSRYFSKKIHLPYFDLDALIEKHYFDSYGKNLNCRAIMIKHGEKFFRDLEFSLLKNALKSKKNGIFSLGGGAAMLAHQKGLFKSVLVLHLHQSKRMLWNRLLRLGIPAFFDSANPETFFKRDYFKKSKRYSLIASQTIYHAACANTYYKIKPKIQKK